MKSLVKATESESSVAEIEFESLSFYDTDHHKWPIVLDVVKWTEQKRKASEVWSGILQGVASGEGTVLASEDGP